MDHVREIKKWTLLENIFLKMRTWTFLFFPSNFDLQDEFSLFSFFPNWYMLKKKIKIHNHRHCKNYFILITINEGCIQYRNVYSECMFLMTFVLEQWYFYRNQGTIYCAWNHQTLASSSWPSKWHKCLKTGYISTYLWAILPKKLAQVSFLGRMCISKISTQNVPKVQKYPN